MIVREKEITSRLFLENTNIKNMRISKGDSYGRYY